MRRASGAAIGNIDTGCSTTTPRHTQVAHSRGVGLESEERQVAEELAAGRLVTQPLGDVGLGPGGLNLAERD